MTDQHYPFDDDQRPDDDAWDMAAGDENNEPVFDGESGGRAATPPPDAVGEMDDVSAELTAESAPGAVTQDESPPLTVSSVYREPVALATPARISAQRRAEPVIVSPRAGWMQWVVYALLSVVLLVGAWLRFDAQNWDDYTHLHPDERFLTDVVSQLNGPLNFTDATQAEREDHRLRCEARYPAPVADDEFASLMGAGRGGYFDAECSPLNPNNLGKGLYVYGEFPLFTVHAAGVARSTLSADVHAFLDAYDPDKAAEHVITTHWEGYNGAHLIGRSISALADTLTILVLFLLGRRLYGPWVGLLAAALYAVAGFPVQQAHFWTVDAFTTFWVTLALYFASRVLDDASARRGAVPLLYLLVWAGGTVWDAGYSDYPVLGLVTLGGAWTVTLLAALIVSWLMRRAGRTGGDIVVAASGVGASLVYVAGWSVLIAARLDGFALRDEMITLGMVSFVYAAAALVAYVAAGIVRQHMQGAPVSGRQSAAVGTVGTVWLLLTVGYLVGGLSPWGALFVALAAVAMLIADIADLTDYMLFGLALGGAVASRINVAPLAGIIVVAASIRALPALDRYTSSSTRSRLALVAMTGVFTAALASFVVFRLLQPHAFLGPEIWGLKFNPGWREDISEAAYLTSGDWDAPPNHQWASRTPYFFPWRNIVLWGVGIPLGLVAWAAWAWAGADILRGRRQWTRHAIPFLWMLVAFGWLGGRWVTTMRYFLPIYPALVLFGAWALHGLVVAAWRRLRAHRPRRSVTASWLAFAGSVALLIGVLGYTTVYGFAIHNIHRHQLTRVAASRWFQETVPGDIGIWVERADGARKMVNIGRGAVAVPPHVFRMEDGDTVEVGFTLASEMELRALQFNLLSDPARDDGAEVVRARIFRDDPALGRQLAFEATLDADLGASDSPYGQAYTLQPSEPVLLDGPTTTDPAVGSYVIEVTVLAGGPVISVREMLDPAVGALHDMRVELANADGAPTALDLNLGTQPILTGHGNDIPSTPTHWSSAQANVITFEVPFDGAIRTLEIPHLGDPFNNADEETVTFTLSGPDGAATSATVTQDLSAQDGPLGPEVTVTFDPPLAVTRLDDLGQRAQYTLTLAAEKPVYTSGPVVAWEGDWDDPVPWPVCPLPDDVFYRDDLPSGLSDYDCVSMNVYGGHYQGIKLWMVAEDNGEKRRAMLNALDQADYIVITSNRFYDSLSRIPWRWPMTLAYYDALFNGELGFDLVRTFESPPQIGPLRIDDQVLPTDDLPDWLNEHWEAEEAFHVYDHPAVLVFKKTDAYSPENTRAILDSVALRPVRDAIAGYAADPEPVGVVTWGAKQASQAPTLLHLTDEKWEKQQAGGTWSDMFDMGALVNRSEIVAVIAWWLLIVIAGWMAWPLLFVSLPALPDRGYPAAKITAWLIVAWVAWVGGTADLPTWSRGGIALILLGVGVASLLIIWRRRGAFADYIRTHWRHLLALEGLALLLYGAFLYVRLGNPDLWHNAFGGEKPMDFAYFNGVLRSSVFPPLDPWFAGGYINYYYWGYVLVGAPVKLLGVQPALAYNLIIPTLYSMTGIGVFSIAYNWVRARGVIRELPLQDDGAHAGVGAVHELPGRDVTDPRRGRLPAGNAGVAGLIAVLLAVVLGNLATVRVFVTSVAQMGEGSYTQPALYHQVRQREVEAQRNTIYEDFYQDALEDFKDDHGGREPASAEEMFDITRAAQERTDAYIANYIEHPPLWDLWQYELEGNLDVLRAFVSGFGRVLDGRDVPLASHRWYWAPTRIIAELPNGAGRGAIAEMPYFTFLYGDLHAHMLAFPITLLVLLWLVAEIIGAGRGLRTPVEAGIALGIGALAVGVLRPTNSWDWITYLLLGGAALTYTAWIEAAQAARNRPPSPEFTWLWGQLSPARVRGLWWLLLALPFGLVARLGWYVMQRLQADQQVARGLKPGEEWIDPTLTLSSAVLWAVAALVLVIAAYAALLIVFRARVDRRALVNWIGRVGAFVALTFIAALPFTAYFATAYTSVKPWELETTPLWAYMYVHGTFIFIVVAFLLWQSGRWLRRVTVRDLQGQAVPVIVIGGLLLVTVLGGIVYGAREAAVAQLVVPLIAWSTLLFFLPGQHRLLRAVYALIVLALAISLGVELVVLDGDIGRQNTVFKFYLQVWFMLSVVGGVVVAWMLRSTYRWQFWLQSVWYGGLAILFTLALLYPALATRARFLDRFAPDETPATLDGMAYMKYAIHGEHELWFPLEGDYDMIRWLQDHVEGTPVVAEAHLYPSEYHWGGRISIYTGLPTVLGWRFHQTQQHSLPDMNYLVQTRENNTAAFYELAGEDGVRAALRLADHYDIEYIVVGALERAFYGDVATDPLTQRQTAGHSLGLAKFDTMVEHGLLTEEYAAPRCLDFGTPVEDCSPDQVYIDKIYRVVPGAEALSVGG